MNIQLRKLHLLNQHFMILQLRHTTFITQNLKEIHSGRETGLIDTGPLQLLDDLTVIESGIHLGIYLTSLSLTIC